MLSSPGACLARLCPGNPGGRAARLGRARSAFLVPLTRQACIARTNFAEVFPPTLAAARPEPIVACLPVRHHYDWLRLFFRISGKRRHRDQCPNQAQQRLLFWPISAAQKLAEFNVRPPAPRGSIGLVNDECMTIGRLAPEEPRVAVRAVSATLNPQLFADVRGRSEVGAIESGKCDVVLRGREEDGAEGPVFSRYGRQNGSSSSGMMTRSVGADWHRCRAASWMWVP